MKTEHDLPQDDALNKPTISISFSINLTFENIEQILIEKIADALDEPDILMQEYLAGICDPITREKTELHIRMAKAAMVEYKKTMLQTKP